MKFKVQIVAMTNEGAVIEQSDLAEIERNDHDIGNLGLSSIESKKILTEAQRSIASLQVREVLVEQQHCECCGNKHRRKGKHQISFRSLYGKLKFESPRYFTCECKAEGAPKTFSPLANFLSERSSPELRYLESKWSSYVSYELVEKIIKDSFPVDESLNPASIRNDVLKVAERVEESLEEEQVFFIDGCQRDWESLPPPTEDPITLGIDGTYLKSWKDRKTRFEVIAGKSVANPEDIKYFGMSRAFDDKPKRRLFETLKSQGMQHNHEVVFLSDGEDSIRSLQHYLNPNAIHILDWFHLTMRITGIGQCIKGMMKLDKRLAEEFSETLESTKWNLWHGHVKKAIWCLDEIRAKMWNFEDTYDKYKSFRRQIEEFDTYLKRNATMIPNYSLARRSGHPISTSFVESTVNSLVNKRFCKKQQMQWSEKGSHLLLQVRVKTLNDELGKAFQSWYPSLTLEASHEETNRAA